MTDEKDEDVDPKDVEELQEQIENGGIRADADVFSLVPGKEAVIFIIRNPPGQTGKALAIELPLHLAVQLGSAIINCAIVASKIEAPEEVKEEEKKEEKKIVWH